VAVSVLDLFGNEIPASASPVLHKGAYPQPPGSAQNGKTCGDCDHYRSMRYHNRTYPKCAFIEHRWTHGRGTDIKKSAAACSLFKEVGECGDPVSEFER